MYDLGLSHAARLLYEQRLVRDHLRRVRVYVMDLDGDVQYEVSDNLVSGQVTLDANAESYMRSLQIVLDDQDSTLGFDSTNPEDGVVISDRMIRVHWDVFVPELVTNPNTDKGWVSCPIFTGPVTAYERDGGTLSLECSGKEILAAEPVANFFLKKGSVTVVSAIRRVLGAAGESRFKIFTNSTKKLASNLTVAEFKDRYWVKAKDLARGLSCNMFYDGAGTVVVRPKSDYSRSSPVFVFRDGDYGSVLSDPKISYSAEDMRNFIKVLGKTPDSSKSARPNGKASLPDSHPFSSKVLGRTNYAGTFVRGYRGELIENENFDKATEAASEAKRILAYKLYQNDVVTLDTLVIPHLEPYDYVTITTQKVTATIPLHTYTIPLELNDGSRMTIGYTTRQTPSRSKIRNRIDV